MDKQYSIVFLFGDKKLYLDPKSLLLKEDKTFMSLMDIDLYTASTSLTKLKKVLGITEKIDEVYIEDSNGNIRPAIFSNPSWVDIINNFSDTKYKKKENYTNDFIQQVFPSISEELVKSLVDNADSSTAQGREVINNKWLSDDKGESLKASLYILFNGLKLYNSRENEKQRDYKLERDFERLHDYIMHSSRKNYEALRAMYDIEEEYKGKQKKEDYQK